MAWLGQAGLGVAWQGLGRARQGLAGLGRAGLGKARRGRARHGLAKARLGMARPGLAGLGRAGQGKARMTIVNERFGKPYLRQKPRSGKRGHIHDLRLTDGKVPTLKTTRPVDGSVELKECQRRSGAPKSS
jgi:hypothetical protein